MNIADEDLMAYADGELDAEQRGAIEAALAVDAALRTRVAALHAQREQVAAAYAAALDEPVPDRLRALLESQPKRPAVVRFAAAPAPSPQRASDSGLSWKHWGGMAASVLLGALLGLQFAPRGDGDASFGERGGRMVAGGALAQALNAQLAADAPATVAVQLSFVDKSGRYCRTFSSNRVAGLACRDAEHWAVQVASATSSNGAPAMRQAASSLPRAVLDAVDERIAGSALNADQERAARARDWKR